MTLKLELDVPDSLAEKAKRAGLLNSAAITDWLREELRRRNASELKEVLDRVASIPDEPMSEEEIEMEIAAARAERRNRAARCR